MSGYFAQRLAQMAPVLLLASVISFGLIFILPGDPARLLLGDQLAGDPVAYQQARQQLGLDQPLPVQYADWLGRTLRGDLGTSIRDREPIAAGIAERLPVTLELSALAMLLALALALPSGIVSALMPNSRWDIICSLVSFGGVAVPHFWLGILLIYGLAVVARILPPSGFVPMSDNPLDNLLHMLMPAVTLGLGLSGVLMRQMRSSLLEVLHQEYIVTARAKGLGHVAVTVRHALSNALIPVVTIIGLQVGQLFGGAVIVESIFSIPGIGRWAVDSVLYRDFPVVQAISLIMAVGVLLASITADLAYVAIDPRIRYR